MEVVNHIIIRENEARILRKPHLKAEMVARMYTDGDYSIEGVMEHYGLTTGEVHFAIAYYYDNQETLDAEHNRLLAEVRENAITYEKFLAKIRERQDIDKR